VKDGFVRVAVGTPHIRVADCGHNADEVIRLMSDAYAMKAKILALPELCLTGYTVGDLIMQPLVRNAALEALEEITKASKGMDLLTLVGLPLVVDGRLYNCAAAVQAGAVLGVIPKRNLPGYGEFGDPRYFVPGEESVRSIDLNGRTVPFGGNILFCCDEMKELKVGIEICEDLWAPCQPSVGHALAGATLIVNLSARNEVIGRAA